ncbi:MAG: hypothetical protein KAX78_02690 [Phycisphaerae bacterium]|nr:hypothetical protein [Phycisphaerae bacterium]
MRHTITHLSIGVLGILAAVTIGCQGSSNIVGPEAKLPGSPDSAEFLDRTSSQKFVTENQAMRGMLLLLDGKDNVKTFAQRVGDLRGRGIICPRWDCSANRPLTKGKLAYMVYQACEIPGGVTLLIAGPSRRYCLRELQFRSIISPGAGSTPVSGIEYVAVISRGAAYMETGNVPQTMKVKWSR